MISKHHQFEKLCDDIFALSQHIRFVGIITRMGKLVAGGMRQGMQSMEHREDSSKLYLEFALRNEMRKDFDTELGRTIYSAHVPLNVEGDYVPLHQCIRCGLLYNCAEKICTKPFQHGRCSLCDS